MAGPWRSCPNLGRHLAPRAMVEARPGRVCLKAAIDPVLLILNEPALTGPARAAERHAAVRRIADEIFDFEETAGRAMAR